MSPLLVQAAGAVSAFAVVVGLTGPVRALALRHGLTDRPAPHKAHRAPTPYLGGVAIVGGVLLPPLLFMAVFPALGYPLLAGRVSGVLLGLTVGGAVVVAATGALDDLRGLRRRTRLAVETVAAGAVTAGGARLGLISPQWIDVLLTVAWIVVLTNSVNLLDNTDGALAVVTLGTAVPLAVLADRGGDARLGLLLVALAAAGAGFLVHNAPPARIFMGDAGSLFIGFLLATGVLLVQRGPGGPARPAAVVLLAFVFIVDTALVVISRRRHGRPIFTGGTDHVAHRLARLGLPPYAVLATLLVGAGGAGGLAVLVAAGRLPGRTALAGAGAAAAVLLVMLSRLPGYPATVMHARATGPDRPVTLRG